MSRPATGRAGGSLRTAPGGEPADPQGGKGPEYFFRQTLELAEAAMNQARAIQGVGLGVMSHAARFFDPFWSSLPAFLNAEREKNPEGPPWETARDYLELLLFNWRIATDGFLGSGLAANRFCLDELNDFGIAWINTVFGLPGIDMAGYAAREAELLETAVYRYPEAIREIGSEFGLHLSSGGFEKVAETKRFELYRVLPSEPGAEGNPGGKPVVIIPPYVLGANILCFLPREKKSYVHAFADQGIPTYIRTVKDIGTREAVQVMTGEDDALDTRIFCEEVMGRHNRPVTLNGFCQGGFLSALALLSGELDGLVDAFITCVAPMDGSRSIALGKVLRELPARFRGMEYALKTLPSGKRVVDGKVMGWVYKLMSLGEEAPPVTFFRDLRMLRGREGAENRIQKTAAAINHWMIYDRADLPEAITRLSYASYSQPVAADGTLPVTLFGRELNFRRAAEKGIKWLICVAEADTLVDPASAVAPTDWVDAEVTVFPKGHTSIATTWSVPTSKCALHTRFGGYRGPVRYHLDLQGES